MKLSSSLAQALNTQMNVERANSAFYEQGQIALAAVAWKGFAAYFEKASHEEYHHAHQFRDYLLHRGTAPKLTALVAPNPPTAERDALPLALFRAALAAEQANTARIVVLEDAATLDNDIDLHYYLAKFFEEQRTSECELMEIIMMLEGAQGENAAILEVEERVEELAKKC